MDGKLKAKFKYYGIIWLIAFASIQLIVFAVPNTKSAGFGGSFWIGYFFILVSFVGQFICNALFFRSDTKEKAFLNLPAVSISYGGLVASLAAGALCMTIPYIPYWVGIVVCVLSLAFCAVSVIAARAAAQFVGEREKSVQSGAFFIKSLAADTKNLMEEAQTNEIKAIVKKVFEAVRYSDPMSSEALMDTESRITLQFNSLKTAVNASDHKAAAETADEIVRLITKRNSQCKLLKR